MTTIYAVTHFDYDDTWIDSLWSTREKAQSRLDELFEKAKERSEKYYGKREAKKANYFFRYDIDEYPLDEVED